jgi:hypothetical protein
MINPLTRRGYILTALAGVVAGALLISGLVMTVIPAEAESGDTMIVGESNRAGRSTWLASRGPSVLKLNNTAGNPALDLRNSGGSAPLLVDSSVVVAGLNADLLDGQTATDFLASDGKAADSDLFDGQDSTAFSGASHDHDADYLAIGATAVNSEAVDGYEGDRLRALRGGCTDNGVGDPPGTSWDCNSGGVSLPRAGMVDMVGSVDVTNNSGSPIGILCSFWIRRDGGSWAKLIASDRNLDIPAGRNGICTSTASYYMDAAGTLNVRFRVGSIDADVSLGQAAQWWIYVPD